MTRRIYLAALLLGILALVRSVAVASADISIIDVASGNETLLPNSKWRQVVVQYGASTPTFTTMAREDDSLVLRTYDTSGRLHRTEAITKFTDGYAGSRQYALSANGHRLVYKKGYETNLYLLDITSNSETLLWPDAVSKYGPDIQGLYWMSDDTLVALLGPQNAQRGQVTLLNATSGVRQLLYRPVNFGLHNALAPDRKLLAFQEALGKHSIYCKIQILDLQSGEIVATLGSGSQLMGPLQWSPDGAELSFVEGNNIHVWRRHDRQTRLLKILDDGFLVYNLVFARGQIGYVGGYTGKKESWFGNLPGNRKLILLDAENGGEIRQIRQEFNGSLFYLAACHCIVAEIGI